MINMDVPEIDPNFEPQQRARSNTWPLRPQEFVEKEPGDPKTPTIDESPEAAKQDPLGLAKKTSSRRNAWGNLSYADLITKAIQSSPEQRLTLSQIYDWMVQSVPYFKDKGDSNSSAGWKNSIRHNLSLHSRFMRMQNEGTGKSSWWVLNPEAKPGKSPRRRATSMDTKAYEKKRGRVKKKVDALRAGNSPSGSDFGEGNELLEDPSLVYSLSPQDFRQRTSSNASSIGRLSPIPAVEPDLHDSQVPPMSPIPWNDIPANYNGAQDQYTDSLQTSLANMMVGDPSLSPIGPQDLNDELLLSQGNGIGFQNAGLMAAPPSYDASLRRSPQSMMQGNVGGTINRALIANQSMQGVPLSNSLGTTLNGGSSTFMTQALDVLQSDSLYAQEPITNQDPMMSIGGEVNGMNPSQMNQYTTLNSLNLNSNSAFQSQSLRALNVIQQGQQRQQMLSSQQQQQQRMVSSLPQRQQQSDSLLRQALTQSKQNLFQRVTAGQQMVAPQSTVSPMYSSNSQQVYSQAGTLIQNQQQTPQSMQHALQTTLPNDLEIALSELKGFDCDVDQIINHELTMEGSLECNFDAFNSGNQMQTNTDGEYISMQLGQT